ncbi:hypothetical protein BAUCODRAFT_190376 [Baudoinia panamericana UAMH 10762]|uniref:Uncharacterized protein n=1 Tax=Baudoinia panamericana (strain UAMH 10762) TaxID=717646 RepID=M2N9U2_BAUPA|nr:uncharacterized protein BAUCODRAFT_190376 [Baudoinia panamericana UAMH 10762]EMD00969.1 hypothetical protein BAUCODRAFT_190376 [Baudoinia panamericana UAMH 10762]
MSWMDSWSRPSKGQATPPPFYLTHGDQVPYCHTCGRVIGARRANTSKASSTEVKYCSDKCKRHKPSSAPDSLDSRIDNALVALLQGRVPTGAEDDLAVTSKAKQKLKKGDPRIVVKLSELEIAVFGDRSDPNKVYGRRKNRAPRFILESGEWKSVDMEDAEPTPTTETDMDTAGSLTDDSIDDPPGGVSINNHVRAPQIESEVNFSAGGGERGWAEKIEETPEMLVKRREGQKRAEEKEMVKSAARRAVAFGLLVELQVEAKGKRVKKGQDPSNDVPQKVRRKCEALMNEQVVEPSFAKGDWSIRWRED